MLTLGHSTLPIETFLDILKQNNVALLIDVRTIPQSRHNPQFSQENLEASLHNHGLEYRWMKTLGGLRHPRKDSPNMAWKNTSFRGYADYMLTPEFDAALKFLMELERSTAPKECVLLCAEAVPWRCHRSLIADALQAHEIRAKHIFVHKNGRSETKPHHVTPFAVIEGTHVMYPAANSPEDAALLF